MSSIKCTQCGLVNFSNMSHCQRCRQPLSEFSTIAEQRPFQTNMQEVPYRTQPPVRQTAPAHFQAFQSPPPPPVFHNDGGYRQEAFEQQAPPMLCVKCGGRQSVYLQHFEKDYIPPVVYIGAFIGILPMLIMIAVLRVRHKISAPFCLECWDKFRKAKLYDTLSGGAFFVGVIGSIVALMAFESGFALLVGLAATFSFIIWAQIYKSKYSPKYKKVNRKEVIIDAPSVGEIRFANN